MQLSNGRDEGTTCHGVRPEQCDEMRSLLIADVSHHQAQCFTELKEILSELNVVIKDLNLSTKELQASIFQQLLGRAPAGYVPLKIYYISVFVAIGLGKIDLIIKLLGVPL